MAIKARPCRGCGRDMSDPTTRQQGRHKGHELCGACYDTARYQGTLPEPATPARPRPGVRQCRDCGRGMVTRAARAKHALLRMRYVEAGSHGMCDGCSSRAHKQGLSEPAPRRRTPDRRIGDECGDCGRPMASSHMRTKRPSLQITHVERGQHGLCRSCSRRAAAGKSGDVP